MSEEVNKQINDASGASRRTYLKAKNCNRQVQKTYPPAKRISFRKEDKLEIASENLAAVCFLCESWSFSTNS